MPEERVQLLPVSSSSSQPVVSQVEEPTYLFFAVLHATPTLLVLDSQPGYGVTNAPRLPVFVLSPGFPGWQPVYAIRDPEVLSLARFVQRTAPRLEIPVRNDRGVLLRLQVSRENSADSCEADPDSGSIGWSSCTVDLADVVGNVCLCCNGIRIERYRPESYSIDLSQSSPQQFVPSSRRLIDLDSYRSRLPQPARSRSLEQNVLPSAWDIIIFSSGSSVFGPLNPDFPVEPSAVLPEASDLSSRGCNLLGVSHDEPIVLQADSVLKRAE
jgi:hypothetical protein